MRILIAGAGETGIALARYLRAENHEIVMIDKNPDALEGVSEQLDIQTLTGSCDSPLVLISLPVLWQKNCFGFPKELHGFRQMII